MYIYTCYDNSARMVRKAENEEMMHFTLVIKNYVSEDIILNCKCLFLFASTLIKQHGTACFICVENFKGHLTPPPKTDFHMPILPNTARNWCDKMVQKSYTNIYGTNV